MFLNLKGDFYDWVVKELKELEAEGKKILGINVEEPAALQPLIAKGYSIEFKNVKELKDLEEENFSYIIIPTYFLYTQKETSLETALTIPKYLKKDGEIFCFFGPAWLPSNWAQEGAKIIKEEDKRLIFRIKNNTLSYCFYTNREIELLFPNLKLNRLIILQSGFRKGVFQKKFKENL